MGDIPRSPDPQSERKQFPFDQVGVDLNAPVDRTKEGLAVAMENWRPEIDGALSIRPGQGNGLVLVGGQLPVHSIKRMQDTSSGTLVEAIIAGVGTHVALSDVALTTPSDLGGGWSGDPLSMAIHQPAESVKPYCYLCDRLKMQKVDVVGARKQVGLPRPADLPFVMLSTPSAKLIDSMDVAANWLAGGTAAALAAVLRIDPATRSITAIAYDGGIITVGWACVRPSSMADIGRGMNLTVTGGAPETFVVQDVFQGSAQTTIARAKYETGTQTAWIHLTTPIDQIDVDSMVLLDSAGLHGGPEYVRVLAVERTKTGFTSFRCNTVNTYSSGETAQVVPSFRAYFGGTHIAGDPLTATALQFTVGAGTGYITRNVGAGAPIDCSIITTGVPTKPDDIVHLSVLTDRPDLITEIKFYADIDSATTNVFAVGTDFKKNYLFHAIRQNDLVPVTVGTETALANAGTQYQRGIIDRVSREGGPPNDSSDVFTPEPIDTNGDPVTPRGPGAGIADPNVGNSEDQSSAGINQYAEIKFRVSELLTPGVGRVGSDFSRGLANVAALKVEVIATGAVTVRVDSIVLSGGFGPDVGVAGRPRIYRTRYRDSSTGVVSNWSPATRGGVRPQRQKVFLSLTGIDLVANPEIDKIDIAVYGGERLGWAIAGSVDNPGGGFATVSFEDIFSDVELDARQALTEGNVHYQLWPTVSKPIRGLGTGAGTIFSLSTGAIDLNTAPGTALKVGGLDYTLYRVLSTAAFETVESMGNPSAVTWEIPAPLLENQRLPIFAGPFHGFYFGLGDPLNPWRLYYTNGNDPDTTADANWIDIEAETLQNMLITTDGRMFVWSSEYAFAIDPAFTTLESGGALFAWRRIGAVGMPYRYAMCDMGSAAAFLGRTGIHATSGGQVQVLTDDLRPLFPHEGSPGIAAGGLFPPDTSNGDNLRLSMVRGELMFDYLDTNGARRTLVRRVGADGRAGWRPYSYAVGAQVHYAEEGSKVTSVLLGGVDGKLYRLGRALADAAGAAITGTLQTRSESGGDDITSKYVNDLVADYDTAGATINVTPGYDNFSLTPDGPFALNEAAGRRQRRLDIGAPSGSGRRARNTALRIVSAVTTLRPVIYLWQLAWQIRPETTLLRAHDYHLAGGGGVKFVRGIYLHADTYGLSRSVQFEYTRDDGTTTAITIAGVNHGALTEVYYPLGTGVYMIGSRMRPTDANTWDFVGYRLDGEPAPPLSTEATEWYPHQSNATVYVREITVDIDTAGGNVDLQIQTDSNAVVTTIQAGANSGPANSAGRAQLAFGISTPFYTNLLRIIPSAACRIWGIKFDGDPAPQRTKEATEWFAHESSGTKYIREITVDADTQGTSVDLQVQVDGNTNQTIIQAGANSGPLVCTGRAQTPFAIDTPFYCNLIRLIPSALCRIWGIKYSGDDAPQKSEEATGWMGSSSAARFVQGVVVDIDTEGVPVNLQVQVDGNTVQTTIQTGANSGPVLTNGRAQLAYSFDVPFICHLIRFIPSAACRIWGIKVVDEPEPELAYMWWAQQTDCGMDGFKYFGDGQLTVRSTDDIVLEFDLDGAGTFAHAAVFYDVSTNSGGQRRAYRFRCPVMKCKVVQARLRCATAAGRVAVFKKEFQIEVKGWGAYHVSIDGKPIGTPWQTTNLLGDLHMESGAKV